MSAAPFQKQVPLDYDALPPTGVRKVLNAFEERDLSRIRWSAVVAGLVLAISTQVVLGLLGVAIGVTAMRGGLPRPLESFASGGGLYMAAASLVSLFVGGYAAAKLSGSIRRSDGALSGVLTWAASLVATLFLVTAVVPERGGLPAGLSDFGGAARDVPAAQATPMQTPMRGSDRATSDTIGRVLPMGADERTRAAWGAFGGAILSLVAATIGGAVGAVGAGRSSRLVRDRRDRDDDYRVPGAVADADRPDVVFTNRGVVNENADAPPVTRIDETRDARVAREAREEAARAGYTGDIRKTG